MGAPILGQSSPSPAVLRLLLYQHSDRNSSSQSRQEFLVENPSWSFGTRQ